MCLVHDLFLGKSDIHMLVAFTSDDLVDNLQA